MVSEQKDVEAGRGGQSAASNDSRDAQAVQGNQTAASNNKKDGVENQATGYNRNKDKGIGGYVLCFLLFSFVTWFFRSFFFDLLHGIFAPMTSFFLTGIPAVLTVLSTWGIGVKMKNVRAKRYTITAAAGLLIGVFISTVMCDIGGVRLGLVRDKPPFSSADVTAEAAENTGTSAVDVSDNPLEDPAQPTQGPETLPLGKFGRDSNVSMAELPPDDPITVTVSPEKETLLSFAFFDSFCEMLRTSSSDFEDLPNTIAENKEKLGAVFHDRLRGLIDTDAEPSSDEVNQDQNFTSKTEEANDLQEDIEINGRNLEKQQRLIDLRTQAYAIHEIGELRSLLSNDYASLAQLYEAKGRWNEAYSSYCSSIEYERLY